MIGPTRIGPNRELVFGKTVPDKGREVLVMKKKSSVEQIVSVLKQAEVRVLVAELIRKVGISEQTFCRWKAKYAAWRWIRLGR